MHIQPYKKSIILNNKIEDFTIYKKSHTMETRSLPCQQVLPCKQVLPCRALLLIREYSRPLTNPDWRNSEPIITMFKLYLKISPATSELHYIILTNIKMTEWYNILCRIV
jgi:hypothetical protein